MSENSLDYNYEKVTLGDVAYEVNERITNPSKSVYERFVGLEHFDSGSFTINRWGKTSDVTSSMKLFKKGDLLFARRNAYLKRASLAKFDGVCSGDAIVLRQKSEILVDNFLPLIFNTKRLWDYAISYAAGSMSKRVKWRNLTKYEIPLPPIKKQIKIAEILWTVEGCIGRFDNTIIKSKRLKKRLMQELFTKGIGNKTFKNSKKHNCTIPEVWKIVSLDEILSDIKYGTSKKTNKEKDGFPVLGIPNIIAGKIDETNLRYVDLSNKEKQSLVLINGDILIVRTNGNPRYIGRCALFEKKESWTFASYLIRIRINEKYILPSYLAKFLQSNYARKYFFNRARTSAGNYNLDISSIKSISILLPPLEEQKKINDVLDKLDRTIDSLEIHNKNFKVLKKCILNDLLEGRITND